MGPSNITSPAFSSIRELFQEPAGSALLQGSGKIQFHDQRYIASGVESSSRVFGFFKALFRTSAESERNQNTIKEARAEIATIFGEKSEALKKFDEAFNLKLSLGSPLTKRALLRFKETLSDADKSRIDPVKAAAVCATRAAGIAEEGLHDGGVHLEHSYWKNAEEWYEHESEALKNGRQSEAAKCYQIAKGYHDAAAAYGEGRKVLAHYLIKRAEFFEAEAIALRNGNRDAAAQHGTLQACYFNAAKAEKEERPDVARYWSKAATCLNEAYREYAKKNAVAAQKLQDAGRLYVEAADLAFRGFIGRATAMTEKIDLEHAALFQNDPNDELKKIPTSRQRSLPAV